MDILNEANEYMLKHKDDGGSMPPSLGGTEGDAPQDISLLNKAREKLEYIIYRMCKSYGLILSYRYRRNARKDYRAFVKSRKHAEKKVREAVKKQLFYVRRDIRHLEGFLGRGMPRIRKTSRCL